MERRKQRSRTTFRRMLALLLAVLLIQLLIYLIVFFKGGILEQTEDNAFYILSERTANRKVYLENDMVSRWSNLAEGESEVLTAVSAVLERHGVGIEALMTDQALCQEVVASTADDIVSMLRRNGVTGAFLVLDCPGENEARPGVYIRDYDPASFSADNKDLLMERGLPEMGRILGITMDSYWSALYRFRGEDAAFFHEPVDAARSAPVRDRKSQYFGHWSGRFSLSESDRPVAAYSIPLIWEDGTVFGVLGVDLTVDYLAEQLKYDELGEERSGAYFLGISRDGGTTYETVCTSGPNFRAYFGQADTLAVEAGRHENIVTLGSDSYTDSTIYGAVQRLKLYNTNTPFEGEVWALIGIISGEHLLSFSHQIRSMLLVSTLVSLLLGLVLTILATKNFTKPIADLVDDLQRSDPDKPIRLRRINITEIDALTGAVEDLSNAAAESASRISKIVAMSHIPIGVCEYKKGGDRAFCSRNLFTVLDWPERPEGDAYLPREEFDRRIEEITRRGGAGPGEEQVFRLSREGGRDRWVQLFYREEGETVLSAFLDVTDDVEAKRKIEYERDFDILTDLYNRRAFDEHMDNLFNGRGPGALKVAALLMLDLDNLKYVNDGYGHDSGDRYIQAFAHCLEYFYGCRSVVGRRSGDEFNVFLYGYESREELRKNVAEFWTLVGETHITLPTGEQMRVRASGGLAWYPDDADNYEQLLRLADFAMYSIKHTVKGSIQEFSREEYGRKSILIQGQDALNQLIDGRMVRYAVQPVVSARDGAVYGYEFLMRPTLKQLSSLQDLFLLAKAQSKLLQLEELTWFEAMDAFARLTRSGALGGEARAFINSIGNQYLTSDDEKRLERKYGDLLSRLVIEITENEETSAELTERKKAAAAAWGAQIALDDFGTGFNSERILVDIAPDIVKVDISIVREINLNPNRQALLRNLIGYARERGIMVLAEGVETREELETLIAMGVDYLQGFYLARPDFGVPKVPMGVVEEIGKFYREYRT
nr:MULTISPECIES: EAL domain-containing protein [unclassified Pseudoflavonifractor]